MSDPSAYEAMSRFAQTYGLLYLMLLLAGALLYAFWPANRKAFDDAAQIPLREDEE